MGGAYGHEVNEFPQTHVKDDNQSRSMYCISKWWRAKKGEEAVWSRL